MRENERPAAGGSADRPDIVPDQRRDDIPHDDPAQSRNARERLPNRRRAQTLTVVWRGKPIAVAVGFALDGRVLETFARTSRPESDLDASADDIAILLSLLLQHGVALEEIRHSLGRLHDGTPTSIAGAIVDAAVELARSA